MLSLLALFVVRLAPGIAFQSVAVAAPVMGNAIGLTHARLGLLLGGFMLPGIGTPLLAGVLARRLGDRTVLFGGLVLIAVGALAASRAASFPALLPARIVEGVGGAAVLMLIIKMTTDRYAGPWLSTASAFILTAWPAGLALGLLLLGSAPVALGWRATLGLAGAPAVIGLLLLPVVGPGPTNAPAGAAPRAGAPPLSLVLGASLSWSLLNGVLAIVVGFLPGYLVSLGRSVPGAAGATSLVVWGSAIMIPFGGLLADRVIGRRGGGGRRACGDRRVAGDNRSERRAGRSSCRSRGRLCDRFPAPCAGGALPPSPPRCHAAASIRPCRSDAPAAAANRHASVSAHLLACGYWPRRPGVGTGWGSSIRTREVRYVSPLSRGRTPKSGK